MTENSYFGTNINTYQTNLQTNPQTFEYLNNSHSYTNDFFDLNAEQDSLVILKSQNNKIKQLFEQINCKEDNINSLKEQLSYYAHNSKEFEKAKEYLEERESILKKQIDLLESKLQEAESKCKSLEKMNSDKQVVLQEREFELQAEIRRAETSGKQISIEFENSNKELAELRKDLTRKRKIISEKDNEIETLKIRISALNSQLKAKEDEGEYKCIEYREKWEQSQREKKSLEVKITEMVDLLKRQSNELNDSEAKLRTYHGASINLDRENNQLRKEINELKETREKYTSVQSSYTYIQGLLESKSKEGEQLNQKIQALNTQLTELQDKNRSLERDHKELTVLVSSKDQAQTSLSNTNYDLETENTNLKRDLNLTVLELNKSSSTLDSILSDLDTFTSLISKDLSIGINFAETYLGNVFFNLDSNKDLRIPELRITRENSMFKNPSMFQSLLERINMQNFLSCVSKLQRKIYDEVVFLGSGSNKLASEKMELAEKHSRLLLENSNLKEDCLNKEAYIVELKMSLDQAKSDFQTLEESSNRLKLEINEKENLGFRVFEEVSSDLYRINEKLNSYKNDSSIYSNFIDFQDIQEIFIILESKPNRMTYKDFKSHMKKFFKLFTCLAEEYVNLIRKLNELNGIKRELEAIRDEFSRNKKQMQKENERLVDRNSLLEAELEAIYNENVKKVEISYKAQVDCLRKELKATKDENASICKDKQILGGQMEKAERRFRQEILDYKAQVDELSNSLDSSEKKLYEAVSSLNRLKYDYDCKVFELEDKIRCNASLRNEIEKMKYSIK